MVIGGTACDLIMESEELPFRATKDIDIVLIVKSLYTPKTKQPQLVIKTVAVVFYFYNSHITSDMLNKSNLNKSSFDKSNRKHFG